MTSITSLSGGTDVTALTQATATQRQRPKPPDMTNTAKALGLSADDLQSELKSGKTLNSIAQDKGVSSSDLLSAVKTDLQANKPADAPALPDGLLTQMASDIAAGKGPGGPGGPGGHHHGGGQATMSILGTQASDTTSNLSSLADALGTSSDDLLSQLSSETDLSSLFSQSGSATWSSSGASTGGLAVDLYA